MRQFHASRFPIGLAFAAAVLASLGGCAKPPGDVSGTVSFRGRPVVYGTVNVIGPDQKTYYGVIQNDGTFHIPDVPVGPIRLGIYSPDPYFEPPVPAAVKAQVAKARLQASNGENLPRPPRGAWFRIPAKYADPNTSDLTGTVVSPNCVIDCHLN